MASGGDIMGAVGGAAGMIPALIGRGQNKREAKSFQQTDGYNPNAGLYGGRPGVDEDMAQRSQQQQGQWQAKANEYGAQQQGLHNRGNVSMDQAQGARGMQMDAAEMARARATGAVPSIAQMQADRQMQQAAAAQASAAASARGPAALALAQQNAAGNTATAQGNIAGQAQIAAAQERLAAEQAYAQQAAGIRGGDYQGASTAYGASGQSGQLGLGAGQMGLGYANNESGIRQGAAQAANQQQQTLAQSHGQAEQANQQTAGQNAGSKGLIQTVGDFFSDANAKQYLGAPQAFAAPASADRGGAPDGIPASGGTDWLGAIAGLGQNLNNAQFGQGSPMYSDMGTKNMVSPSAYALTGEGGLDVGATAQLMSDQVAGNYQKDPGAGVEAQAQAPVMMSDARAKLYSDMGAKNPTGVLTLDSPGLRVGRDGRGYVAEEAPQQDKWAAMAARESAAARSAPAAGAKRGGSAPKKMSNDELAKWAREMLGQTEAQKGAQLARGPAVSPLAEANRSLAGAPYTYKEGFRPPEQAPGEVNVGPTAQVMEQSPVTATAVRRDPKTGVRSLDRDKMLKVVASGVADLQKQQDETRLMLAGKARRG